MIYSRPINRRLKRCATLLAACGFVLQSLGVSVPAGYEAADLSPFPCQGHRCGCRTAEQCWRECCCFTVQQRLVWAQSHGITPPEHLVAVAAVPSAPAPRACCQKVESREPVSRACSTHRHRCAHCLSDEPSQEVARVCANGKCAEHSREVATAKAIQWVSLVSAQHCQGNWQTAFQSPACLPLKKLVACTVREPGNEPLCQRPADLFFSPSFEPLLPPPRCS